MARTEAQKRARQNYEAKAYDLISFKARKGKSEEYTKAAAAIGVGKMEMFRRAVEEFISRHAPEYASGEGVPIINTGSTETAQNAPATTDEQTIEPAAKGTLQRITAADTRLLSAIDALSPESKKALLKFLESLKDS